MIIVHILISIAFYFILMLLSVNLLGFFVRGFFTNLELEKLKLGDHEFITQEIKRIQRIGKWTNIVAFLLIIAYLYLTFYFWNIGVTAVAVVFMLVRLLDLLWEIKTGKKITIFSMPKNTLSFITSFLMWASLPALYYFLYHF